MVSVFQLSSHSLRPMSGYTIQWWNLPSPNAMAKAQAGARQDFTPIMGRKLFMLPLEWIRKGLQSQAKPVSMTLWWDNALTFQPTPWAMHSVLEFLTLQSDGSFQQPPVPVLWNGRAESLTTASLSHSQIHRAHQQVTQQLPAADNK